MDHARIARSGPNLAAEERITRKHLIDDRHGIDNLVLCLRHAKMVDVEAVGYTVAKLVDIKRVGSGGRFPPRVVDLGGRGRYAHDGLEGSELVRWGTPGELAPCRRLPPGIACTDADSHPVPRRFRQA